MSTEKIKSYVLTITVCPPAKVDEEGTGHVGIVVDYPILPNSQEEFDNLPTEMKPTAIVMREIMQDISKTLPEILQDGKEVSSPIPAPKNQTAH